MLPTVSIRAKSPLRAAALLLALLPVLAGCAGDRAAFTPPAMQLRTGDIVLRRGTGADSRAVTAADDSCRYSHIGMIVETGGLPLVLHIEPDSRSSSADTIRTEPLASFFATGRASGGVIYRIGGLDSASRERLHRTSSALMCRGVKFDRAYSAADHSAFYCTELVWHIYLSATGIDLTETRRHRLPLMPPLIFCSDIERYSDKQLIYKF